MTSSADSPSKVETEELPGARTDDAFEKIPGERYEMLCRLGVGAFGSVYKALDSFLNRPVAVKSIRLDTSLDPAQRKALNKRFIREAQVAAQLHHANIVTIHDIIFTPDTGFIVMEFIEGETLQALLERERLGLERAVDIVKQVGRALDYAHQHKVIHRDVKPANIMITPSFEARITDFGIAKADGATHLTHSGSLVGTPDYMSPEQAKGEEVDARTDLFSLGCVLFECLCGQKPFLGGNLTAVLLSIVNTDPLASKEWKKASVPAELTGVLERALAKDPEQRFLSAGAFVSALESLPSQIFGEETEASAPPASAEPAAPDPSTIAAEQPAAEETRRLGEAELAALKEDDRPLRFAPSLSDDLQEMQLTPAEGYVLSRIDGTSRARDILAVSPLPEAEAAATLADLLEKGLLAVVDEEGGANGEAEPVTPLDATILEEAEHLLRLGKDKRYSELLGIDISTPTADVKKAYLELVQRFHPDAQEGNISDADRKKLSRVCAIATEALTTVSGKRESPRPSRGSDPAATGSQERRSFAAELFKRAQEAYEVTDFWEAIQLSRQAIELDPDAAPYHHLLGLGLMKNQNWIKEAEESLQTAVTLDATKPEYFTALAELYARQGMNERASAMSEKAKELELSPSES